MFRVRKTCLKMLTKRGYIVDEEDVNMTTEDFKMKFGDDPSRESLTILVEKADDPTDQLFVFFPTDEKVGVKPIKTYCTRMKEENVLRAVIVVRGNFLFKARVINFLSVMWSDTSNAPSIAFLPCCATYSHLYDHLSLYSENFMESHPEVTLLSVILACT